MNLLRTNWDGLDPGLLWWQYIQLTEVEEAFRVLKSELLIRPIWHRLDLRVEAHIMIAFLGYCLWVCLKQRLRGIAGSLTPARVIESQSKIMMMAVWCDLGNGGHICLPWITEPETEQGRFFNDSDGNYRSNPHRRSTPMQCPPDSDGRFCVAETRS